MPGVWWRRETHVLSAIDSSRVEQIVNVVSALRACAYHCICVPAAHVCRQSHVQKVRWHHAEPIKYQAGVFNAPVQPMYDSGEERVPRAAAVVPLNYTGTKHLCTAAPLQSGVWRHVDVDAGDVRAAMMLCVAR
jgi:hypothetical protein